MGSLGLTKKSCFPVWAPPTTQEGPLSPGPTRPCAQTPSSWGRLQPLTGPRRASLPSGPLLAHICRTSTWTPQSLWPRADCGTLDPWAHMLYEGSLGDLWPATLRGCLPRLSRHWPKERFKAGTSQSLTDAYTPPSPTSSWLSPLRNPGPSVAGRGVNDPSVSGPPSPPD